MNEPTHEFTSTILAILEEDLGELSADIFKASDLLKYINIKTRSASKGSKSRGSFGNLYAIYVLVEDYVAKGFHESGEYEHYDGAQFAQLFRRQRELPFGSKLQNHALNHRLNQEFRKYYPASEVQPIIRDPESLRYWVNENLLTINVAGRSFNIGPSVLRTIDAYVEAKTQSFNLLIDQIEAIRLASNDIEGAQGFIKKLVQPNVDARVFEIASFAILHAFYSSESIFLGWSMADVEEQELVLYKTGRTNANDGGIDFVMRPLGRFFQVTETLDVSKYFLDIEKIQRFPLTFVVKSELSIDAIEQALRLQAKKTYVAERVVASLMDCIEEIINIPELLDRFDIVVESGRLDAALDQLVTHARLEFQMEEDGVPDGESVAVSVYETEV